MIEQILTCPSVVSCSLGRFIREKLRTTDLVSNIADQLYDHFTMTTGADRKLSMAGLKTLITEIQLDPYVAMTREVKLAFRLIESLIPRIIGSIAKVRPQCNARHRSAAL